jgi:hypothetical protein
MRRIGCVIGLMALLMSATGSPATGQGSDGDAARLEALCEANAAEERTLATCLYAVHTLLLPGSGVDVAEAVDPGTEAGVGMTLRSGTWEVTLRDVTWDACTFTQPAEDHEWVAAEFAVLNLEGPTTVGYSIISAIDQDGNTYELDFRCPDPCLGISDLEQGHIKQGLVAFEVPEDTDRLEIGVSGPGEDRLTWVVAR